MFGKEESSKNSIFTMNTCASYSGDEDKGSTLDSSNSYESDSSEKVEDDYPKGVWLFCP
jgi:hypothetical protein